MLPYPTWTTPERSFPMPKFALLPVAVAFALLMPLSAEHHDENQPRVLPMLFHEGTDDGRWTTVNDTVMGGVSSSRYEFTEDGTFIFRGDLSLENNGGFASVRSRLQPMDLAEADAFRLRVRGDGHKYQLRFRIEGEWQWVNYSQRFDTKDGEWIEVELPVDKFQPGWRGEPVRQAPPFDPANSIEITLMATDKQEGEFQLEVDWISAVFHQEENKATEAGREDKKTSTE